MPRAGICAGGGPEGPFLPRMGGEGPPIDLRPAIVYAEDNPVVTMELDQLNPTGVRQ